MHIRKIGFSIIPRKCSCGCGKRYFSPMWEVGVPIPTDMNPRGDYECELYSCKEYPKQDDIPSLGDFQVTENVGVAYDFDTDHVWDVVCRSITINEFLDIPYNIHIFPIQIGGLNSVKYVVLCVQEIPSIIASGTTFDEASDRLREKMKEWFSKQSHSLIPKPQAYDKNFKIPKPIK